MKKIRTLLAGIVALVALAAAPAANAQFFKWGPRVGVNVNKLSFNKNALNDLKDSENRAGFTGGLMVEFTVPIIGIGVDVSAMYVHRTTEFTQGNTLTKKGQDYIDIPLNLKWKINLPAVNHIVRPYIATGPDFAILASKKAITDALETKSCNLSWNVGAGVELFKHLQVGASYGFGLGKAVTGLLPSGVPSQTQDYKIEGKNKFWTVTAAWLF